jgi:hypothetical protein
MLWCSSIEQVKGASTHILDATEWTRSIVSATDADAALMGLCFKLHRGNRLKSRYMGNHHGSCSPKRNLIDGWESLQDGRTPRANDIHCLSES